MPDPRGLDSPWEARTNLAGQTYAEQCELDAQRADRPARCSDEGPALPSPRQCYLNGVYEGLELERRYGAGSAVTARTIEREALRYPTTWEAV